MKQLNTGVVLKGDLDVWTKSQGCQRLKIPVFVPPFGWGSNYNVPYDAGQKIMYYNVDAGQKTAHFSPEAGQKKQSSMSPFKLINFPISPFRTWLTEVWP